MLGIIALVGLYIVNVLHFRAHKKIIEADLSFKEWIEASSKNKLCFSIIKYASLVMSFKA